MLIQMKRVNMKWKITTKNYAFDFTAFGLHRDHGSAGGLTRRSIFGQMEGFSSTRKNVLIFHHLTMIEKSK